MGVMFHDGTHLVVHKYSHCDAEQLFEALAAAPLDVRVAVHLRAATYGARDDRNVHPQILQFADAAGLQLAVMHNGSISALLANALEGPSVSR